MDRSNLLPIGQFSQASGLSVTAVRHYDASGVLVPTYCDSWTSRWKRCAGCSAADNRLEIAWPIDEPADAWAVSFG